MTGNVAQTFIIPTTSGATGPTGPTGANGTNGATGPAGTGPYPLLFVGSPGTPGITTVTGNLNLGVNGSTTNNLSLTSTRTAIYTPIESVYPVLISTTPNGAYYWVYDICGGVNITPGGTIVEPTGTQLAWSTRSSYTMNASGTFTVPVTGIYLITLDPLIANGIGNGGYATICVAQNTTLCYSWGNVNPGGAGGVCYMSSASVTAYLIYGQQIIVRAGPGAYGGADLDINLTTLTFTLLTQIQ